jgi:hypothetical protein
MKNTKKELIIGIVSIIILLVFFAFIINSTLNYLKDIKPETVLTVFATMFTVLLSLFGIIYTQKQIKIREIEEAHRDKKIEIYNKFITISANMIAGDNPNIPSIKPYEEEELIIQIFQFKKDLLLWGSPKVISATLEFVNSAKNNSPLILASINNLYQSMREDIGLSNKKLKKHELIKILLSDPEEVDKLIQNSERV